MNVTDRQTHRQTDRQLDIETWYDRLYPALHVVRVLHHLCVFCNHINKLICGCLGLAVNGPADSQPRGLADGNLSDCVVLFCNFGHSLYCFMLIVICVLD